MAILLINQIEKEILETLESKTVCSVMLTGGNSVISFYSQWSQYLENCLSHIIFYFGDERCVSPSSVDSNFFTVNKYLFNHNRNSELSQVYRIRAESDNMEAEAARYSLLLPNSIDILLLSMGHDGHIASLFPNSPALLETERKVVPVTGPKAPFKRITITPPVIQAAKQVYVLAIGEEKKCKYEEALLDPDDINSIPARLVLNRTWIFDLNQEIDVCPKS
ncbi:6-phosphogluconolactonase [Alphaproteobacteria bacterium LSUCC0744]